MIDYSAHLARQIRVTRESRGMTQTDLAKAMKDQGLPFWQQTIQRIEEGSREVRVPELFALASALGVPPGELVGVPLPAPLPDPEAIRRAFCDVARGVVTGQMEERIALAWRVFQRSVGGVA